MYKIKIFILLAFLTLRHGYAWPALDLEDLAQEFVLEVSKITIPDIPYPFNPSIVEWQGKYLLSFRTRDPLTNSTNPFGLVWLDSSFKVCSIPQIINMPSNYPFLQSKAQDPRLIVIQGELYIVYNNIIESVNGEIRRMQISKLKYEDGFFEIVDTQALLHYPFEIPGRNEKNWTPFDYEGHLLLSYSLTPHRILYPVPQSTWCEDFTISHGNIKWPWGELRGGTTALKIKEGYLSFFHSCANLSTVHSEGKKMTHYFMGAYLFQDHPPFSILKISKEPIYGKDFYNGPAYTTWKPLRVIFPCGFVMDENYIWVVFGKQDHESWIVKLDKNKLLESLVQVQ